MNSPRLDHEQDLRTVIWPSINSAMRGYPIQSELWRISPHVAYFTQHKAGSSKWLL